LAISKVKLPEPLGPKLFILGEPVLHRYYTVYDWQEKKVPRGAPGAYLCEKLIVNIDVEGETEFESSQKPCNICGSLYIYIYIHIYILLYIYIGCTYTPKTYGSLITTLYILYVAHSLYLTTHLSVVWL
jgi:hypothetical protein